MAGEEQLEADVERNNDEVGRDTDDEEGTGELAKAKDRESRGLDMKNASTSKRRLQGRGSGNKTRQGKHWDRRAQQRQGQGIAGPDMESATHVRAETPETGKRERDAARRAPENHTRATRAAGQQSSKDKDSTNTGDRAGKQRRNIQDQDTGEKGGTRDKRTRGPRRGERRVRVGQGC